MTPSASTDGASRSAPGTPCGRTTTSVPESFPPTSETTATAPAARPASKERRSQAGTRDGAMDRIVPRRGAAAAARPARSGFEAPEDCHRVLAAEPESVDHGRVDLDLPLHV